MSSACESKAPRQRLIVVLSFLPIVWTALLIAWLADASPYAGTVFDRRNSSRSWLDFGGNPAEVYSHWLDFAAMSGNAVTLSWLLVCEWLAVRKWMTPRGPRFLVMLFPLLAVALCWGFGYVLDRQHGEGTTLVVIPVFFAPILAASFLLIRGAVLHLRTPKVVLLVAASFTFLHLISQLFYEASGTGGPNDLVLPAAALIMLILALERYLLDRGDGTATFDSVHSASHTNP